jgi:NAD(P)-dependent dehydrogenase (short-subunit alcohol dehydrogenase family)
VVPHSKTAVVYGGGGAIGGVVVRAFAEQVMWLTDSCSRPTLPTQRELSI